MDKVPSQHRGYHGAETEVSLGVSRAQHWPSTPAGGAEAQNPTGNRKEGEVASGRVEASAVLGNPLYRPFQQTGAWALEHTAWGQTPAPLLQGVGWAA